jgi:hypothetical protein
MILLAVQGTVVPGVAALRTMPHDQAARLVAEQSGPAAPSHLLLLGEPTHPASR